MKRLMLMRHCQSQGNRLGIIQGPDNDYDLTDEGMEEAYNTFRQNKDILITAKKIVSSPLKRAIQTGQIINSCYGKDNKRDFQINSLLVEFYAGLLSGMQKSSAEKTLPEYYKIWMAREDLDEIPNAEKGQELQARAISFLMNYYNEDDYSDLIITHAGFLRCLLNTINGKPRTTPIDVKNAVLYVVEDPLKKLNITRKTRAMSSKVYIVETADGKYVVKHKERKLQKTDEAEKKVLNNLKKNIENLPLILYMNNDKKGSTKVIKHVPGIHLYGEIPEELEYSFVDKIKLIHELLQEEDETVFPKRNLLELPYKAQTQANNQYVRMIAKSIMEDTDNTKKLLETKYCLVHPDLNRDNVLFNKEGNVVKTNIIDWESIGLYPKDYQLASLLASGFLLYNGNMNRVMQLAGRFDSNFDKEFILYLMKIRLFNGIYFFAEEKNVYVKNNSTVSNEILQKYISAYSKIEEYEKNIEKKTVQREEK